MKERPILFSSPMIKALLAGTKTQTRRIVKPQQPKPSTMDPYELEWTERDGAITAYTIEQFVESKHNRYGQPGDRLWVRETWQPLWASDKTPPSMKTPEGWSIGYPATDGVQEFHDVDNMRLSTRCKPSIFMPRWASRITLEITGVRVERLHAITKEDAKAEGVEPLPFERRVYPSRHAATVTTLDHRAAYQLLWEAINGAESWRSNPWVWVVTFRGVSPLTAADVAEALRAGGVERAAAERTLKRSPRR